MTRTEPIVRPMHESRATKVDRSRGATIQVLLGADDGMPHFYTRCFTLEPGGRIPAHRHEAIEHEQVMLQGEMAIGLGGEERIVREGDCMYIPARVSHWYENRGQTPVRFLCIIPGTPGYQTEWLEPALS